jgi:hypothetical protein
MLVAYKNQIHTIQSQYIKNVRLFQGKKKEQKNNKGKDWLALSPPIGRYERWVLF